MPLPRVVKPRVVGTRVIKPKVVKPKVVKPKVVKPKVVKPQVVKPQVSVRPTTPRVTVPITPTPTPTPTVSAAGKEKRAIEKTIAAIKQRIERVEAEFHAIGRELASLDRPAVFAAFGVPNFRAFLDAHVMPANSAYRFIAVAREFDEPLAVQLGVEKAYQLTRYVEVAKVGMRASLLAESDRAIGTPKRRISQMTARDIENLVRTQTLQTARAAAPRPTARDRKAAHNFAKRIEADYGVDATVRVDKKRGVVRVEVRLTDLLE